MNFEKEVRERIDANGQNEEMKSCAHNFMNASSVSKYTYNFSWLGRPIIQYPQDIIAMQELIWA
ncbi:MAG: cephalosporin hydroxylase, partial [Thermoplasmata archaeon]|nr:cephalosporin hydroxylase [Thermoplasmata archaeon]